MKDPKVYQLKVKVSYLAIQPAKKMPEPIIVTGQYINTANESKLEIETIILNRLKDGINTPTGFKAVFSIVLCEPLKSDFIMFSVHNTKKIDS